MARRDEEGTVGRAHMLHLLGHEDAAVVLYLDALYILLEFLRLVVVRLLIGNHRRHQRREARLRIGSKLAIITTVDLLLAFLLEHGIMVNCLVAVGRLLHASCRALHAAAVQHLLLLAP